MGCGLVELYVFLGRKWSYMLFSRMGSLPVSFNELQELSHKQLNPTLVSSRLKQMIHLGIIEKKIMDGRVVYVATPKGLKLKEALHVVKEWADDTTPLHCRGMRCVCAIHFKPYPKRS